MNSGQQHPRVFARTVIMKLIERQAVALKLPRRVYAVRSMRAATKRRFIKPRASKHLSRSFRVNLFAFVRSGRGSKLAVREIEMVCRAARDDREGLNGFDCRPG